MKIGKPRRIHRVEPLRQPVPGRADPPEAPEKALNAPKEVPAK